MIWKSLYVSCSTAWLKYTYGRSKKMMAKIFFNRLLVGTITFDAVPEKYQEAVRQYGIQWVQAGKLSIEEYEMLYKEPYPEEA